MKERDITTLGPIPTGFEMIRRLSERPTCTVEEAAAACGIGRSTAYAAAKSGELPVLKMGSRLLVPCAVLFDMLGLERDLSAARESTVPGLGIASR